MTYSFNNSINSFHSPGTGCSWNNLFSRNCLSWVASSVDSIVHNQSCIFSSLSLSLVAFQGAHPFQIFQQHISHFLSVKRKQAIICINSCHFLWISTFLKLSYQGLKFFLLLLLDFITNTYRQIFFFIFFLLRFIMIFFLWFFPRFFIFVILIVCLLPLSVHHH